MIQIIFGKRGTGKTKRIIDLANGAIKEQKGDVLFIDDDNRYMFDLRHEIRFVNAGEYGVRGVDKFIGFINGIMAGNFDVSLVFIDAFLRLVQVDKPDIHTLEGFFNELEEISSRCNVDFVISLSEDSALVPDPIRKFAI
ncbi:MAG: hypothetical protein FWE77_05185 [Clostridia bacterium]|nr:hypothetical protein [Clostridia bacterium]